MKQHGEVVLKVQPLVFPTKPLDCHKINFVFPVLLERKVEIERIVNGFRPDKKNISQILEIQTAVIGANNPTNQVIDNGLPFPHSPQRKDAFRPHRAAAAPIQSNVFDAISERHRGYEAAVHRNSLLLIANQENFLRSTPRKRNFPPTRLKWERSDCRTEVIRANNQTSQGIDNRLPFPHPPQRTDAFRPHKAAAAPIQSNVFDAIAERHRTEVQTGVIGADNQTNQAIDNRLSLPHPPTGRTPSDHTRQQRHPSRTVSLMQLTNATVGYEAAVHRNSLLLIANRENFLRSTPRKVNRLD
ncbi:hypothetical protein CEXT_313601 [Caerostris extrusa]|uniref:Uncharacterized protein n=1 Tax=Caerostris extrusa TaxID=172846 RepID=A0AAV4W9K8_CAEEX|nr:hypothetical protein CEXT_313601 [Caerostris extrusa]